MPTEATAPARRPRAEPWLWFALTSALYLGAGCWLLSNDLIFPDALSRVANGYYVLFSRDPHLAAIGFVWNPLPSLATLPLLAFSPWIPALAGLGAAGTVVSALCGGGCVALLAVMLRELGVTSAWARGLLTGLFAVQALVVLGAATGASEAMLLLTCFYTALHLLRWLREADTWSLVHVGTGLGLAYLTRYEAAAPAIAVVGLVFVVSVARASAQRWSYGVNDAALAGLPFAAAALGWAVTSKVIVGTWFATFTSQYGNSAQVTSGQTSIESVTGSGLVARTLYLSEQLVHLAPLALPATLAALMVAWVRREPGPLAAVAVFGAVLAFDDLTFLWGSSFGWIRLQMAAIPLGYLALGYLLAAARRRWLTCVLVLALAVTTPLGWLAEANPRLGREETLAREVAAAGQYPMQRAVATDLDDVSPADGSIITDVAYSFPVFLASRHPHSYVITTDRDFQEALADPAAAGVTYALLASPQNSPSDAVELAYPGMFENGAGVATLTAQWQDARGTTWRLYRFA
ncbi:MAG TPA: hypothetical protein PLK46_00360 [Propioniciclava sp.]|uniref:hypothetical protein n=1 Tax=Propioniciclava sp. TaxID=2038686 RepID=UPI002D15F0E3|nr:hypothetical protein [Propioniciclava sp.]HRL47851.1 hypothetical protein [Propioniciclava sp.]HRL78765.1 hypothetical protein [Propioniciclava sp.]